jgi:hypothetical protein
MCLYCNERYSEFPSLYQHTSTAHSRISEAEISKAVNKIRKEHKVKINFMSLICKICDATFNDYKVMKEHLLLNHEKRVNVENDGVFPYKINEGSNDCLLCGTTFSTFVTLNRHINSHFPFYVCNLCGVGYATARRLNEHKVYHHADRSHSCEICFKSFPTASRLKLHISRTHSQSTLPESTDCDETLRLAKDGKDFVFVGMLIQLFV